MWMFATRKRPPTTTAVCVNVRLRSSSLNRMTAIIVAALLKYGYPLLSRPHSEIPADNYARVVSSQFSWNYDRTEILADSIVHVLCVTIAIGGAAVLMVIAVHAGNITRITAVSIYLSGLLAV